MIKIFYFIFINYNTQNISYFNNIKYLYNVIYKESNHTTYVVHLH